MKVYLRAVVPCLGIALFLVSGTASAQRSLAQTDAAFRTAPAFYVGAGAGGGHLSFDNSDFNIAGQLNAAGLCTGCTQSWNKSTWELAWKVFAGYRFTPHIGIEGSYVDLGSFKQKFTIGGGGTGNLNADYRPTSWNAAVVGRLPFPESGLYAQGKIGAAFTTVRNSLKGNVLGVPIDQTERDSKTNLYLGAGLGYDFASGLGLIAEYEYFGKVGNSSDTGRATADLISVSAMMRF